MGLRRAAAGLFLVVAATSAKADGPRPLPKEVQGKWVASAVEFAGKRPPAEIVKGYKAEVTERTLVLDALSFDGERFTAEGKPFELRYTCDPAAKPQAIDLVPKDGDDEYRMQGIYAVEGGQLKLCWQHDGQGRPTEFQTKAQPTQMLLVLKRPKP
jgi:uncharacterized protein (TIGR03067 family)